MPFLELYILKSNFLSIISAIILVLLPVLHIKIIGFPSSTFRLNFEYHSLKLYLPFLSKKVSKILSGTIPVCSHSELLLMSIMGISFFDNSIICSLLTSITSMTNRIF